MIEHRPPSACALLIYFLCKKKNTQKDSAGFTFPHIYVCDIHVYVCQPPQSSLSHIVSTQVQHLQFIFPLSFPHHFFLVLDHFKRFALKTSRNICFYRCLIKHEKHCQENAKEWKDVTESTGENAENAQTTTYTQLLQCADV